MSAIYRCLLKLYPRLDRYNFDFIGHCVPHPTFSFAASHERALGVVVAPGGGDRAGSRPHRLLVGLPKVDHPDQHQERKSTSRNLRLAKVMDGPQDWK